VRWYDADCIVEQAWIWQARTRVRGIDAVRRRVAATQIDRYAGAMPPRAGIGSMSRRHRWDIETGWGRVRAEWVRA
jgi:hypothetical protein